MWELFDVAFGHSVLLVFCCHRQSCLASSFNRVHNIPLHERCQVYTLLLQEPMRRNLMMIAAHVVWGATMGVVAEVLMQH